MRLQTQGKALECVLEREKQNAPGRFYVSVKKLTMPALHIVSSGSNQTNMASPWNGKWLPLRTRFRTLSIQGSGSWCYEIVLVLIAVHI